MSPEKHSMFLIPALNLQSIAVAAAVIAIGCSKDGPPVTSPDGGVPPVVDAPEADAPPSPDAPPAPTAMTVRGTGTVHWVGDTGTIDRPFNLSRFMFTSFTPTANGFEQRSGTGSADGSFDVPVGLAAPSWQLGFNATGQPPTFLDGNSLRPDLSFFLLGRPDRRFPAQPTSLTINATGLAPWQLADDLGIVSSNAGALLIGTQVVPISVGDIAIAGKTTEWSEALIDAAKGDSALVFQLSGKPADPPGSNGFYVALTKAGVATPFTMTDGAATAMTVELADVPQSSALTVHVRRSQFDALRAQVGPGAQPSLSFQQSMFIHALPRALQRGLFDAAPRVARFIASAGTEDYDQSFTYGNPFKTAGLAWDEFMIARHNFVVPVLAAGATTAANLEVGFVAHLPVSALAVDGTIAPGITPVRNVKIAGLDLMTPRTGVGLTPTVTWDAPAIGAPTCYSVRLRRVAVDGSTTTVRVVATFLTTATTLTLPGTLLSSGGSYLLEIEAQAIPDYEGTRAPFVNGLPAAFANAATAQFTP
jgi:hypothetical protein